MRTWMVVISFWACVPASAASVTVERIDGRLQQCSFSAASSDAITVTCDELTSIPLDELTRIEFGRRSTDGEAEGAVLYLDVGGRLRGDIVDARGESVVADTSVGDDLEIGLSFIAGIWFGSEAGAEEARAAFDRAIADRLPGKDVLLIEREGAVSLVRGRVVSLGADGGTIRLNRKEFDFKREGLVGIVFAAGVGHDTRVPALVRLADGTELPGRIVEADAHRFVFAPAFEGEVEIPLAQIASVTFFSDRVTYLSTLSPVNEASSGVLHSSWPTRFDRNVINRTISLGGRSYERGIGMRADAAVEYDLGGGFETFAATIGIDDAVRPRGTVRFRVEGDGRELFDSGVVTGEDEAQRIAVDVRGVSRLTLMVGNADGLDLSDHADWADARLIKPREGGD